MIKYRIRNLETEAAPLYDELSIVKSAGGIYQFQLPEELRGENVNDYEITEEEVEE